MFGFIPQANNSSSFNWACVVDAGCITNDLTSATLASNENNSRLSMKSFAFWASPLISKVNIEPAPFGKYFLYNSCCLGSSVIDGWWTFSTCGWLFKYSTTFNAFSTCLSTLNDKVSNPCKKKKAWNGESVAPVSLSNIALIFVTKAAGPAAFVKLTPW
mgnify:CR=1 FL=1